MTWKQKTWLRACPPIPTEILHKTVLLAHLQWHNDAMLGRRQIVWWHFYCILRLSRFIQNCADDVVPTHATSTEQPVPCCLSDARAAFARFTSMWKLCIAARTECVQWAQICIAHLQHKHNNWNYFILFTIHAIVTVEPKLDGPLEPLPLSFAFWVSTLALAEHFSLNYVS